MNLLKKAAISPQQIMYLMLANVGYALALNMFYLGNNIAAGGLAGIATVINSFFDIPAGTTVFLLNLPIVLWGLTIKGKSYILMSMVTTAVYSLIVDVLSFLPCMTDDKIVAVICGGVLYGISSYFSVRAQISTGGTDLLAKLLITKFKSASIGQLLMIIDSSIVVMAMIAYRSIESGIYAVLAIAAASIVTDKLNSGFNKATVFYIFASKNIEKISEAILYDMGRGATLIHGEGAYQHAQRPILFVVVKPHEAPRLREIVHKHDRSAFIVIAPATEIVGEGFERLNLTSTIHDDDAAE